MRLRIPERAAKAWGRTWFLLGLGLLFGAYLASRVAAPDAAAYVYNALLVACAYVALRTPHRHGPERAAWLCLGAALCLWAAGDFYYTLFLVGTEAAPPTVTDWLWLASYPLLYAAVALLVRARTAHLERSLWLDAVPELTSNISPNCHTFGTCLCPQSTRLTSNSVSSARTSPASHTMLRSRPVPGTDTRWW